MSPERCDQTSVVEGARALFEQPGDSILADVNKTTEQVT